MTETPQQTRKRLNQEAVAWQVRLTSGALTEETNTEFANWRRQSQDHDRAYRDIEQLWQQLPSPLHADRQRRRDLAVKRRRAQFRQRTIGFAAAASLLLVVIAGLYPDYFSHPLADYHTRIGEQTSVQLADGSIVHLNTDTAIDVKLSGNERRIELLGGEAEFEVAHDSGRPFRVIAGQTATEALGTRFVVRYDGTNGSVTLMQGKVRASQISAQDAGTESATLKAGQQIAFTAFDLGAVQPADLDTAEAWRRGRLLMNFVPLKQVIAEINRYRRGQIRLLDDKLGEREVNIAIDIRHIDAWLEALQTTLPIKMDKVGPLVFLHS